jgi:hypothetical protein
VWQPVGSGLSAVLAVEVDLATEPLRGVSPEVKVLERNLRRDADALSTTLRAPTRITTRDAVGIGIARRGRAARGC